MKRAAKSREAGDNSVRTIHPDAQWFSKAPLGLFLHWGISSVGEENLSWAMFRGEGSYTPAQYWKLANRFKAENYDPDKWLRAAKAAGFEYAVLTARHCDGYALWPSRFGNLGVRTHLGGRDLVAGFVKACRKNDLKVGFYYSGSDWFISRKYMSYAPGHERPLLDFHHRPVAELPVPSESFNERLLAYRRGQITELLTRYGKIDVMWFDCGQIRMLVDEIRKLQPGIVINDRGDLLEAGDNDELPVAWPGDYRAWEGYSDSPRRRPSGWWELCEMWNNHWGDCSENVEKYYPTGYILNWIARTRSWNGAFLINFAPRSDGAMPQAYYDKMAELTAWMKHSGASLTNVRPGPWPEQSNVPVTVKGRTWYLFACAAHTHHTGRQLTRETRSIRLRNVERPASAKLLRTGERLDFAFNDGKVAISIPKDSKSPGTVDVVAVRW